MDVERAQKVVLRKEAQTLREKGYSVGRCFREGRYSKLCKAYYRAKSPPSEDVIKTSLVCKIMEKGSLPHLFSRKLLPMQMEVLGRLEHSNIVQIHSILASELRYFIFMEDCEMGNLFDFLHRHGPLNIDLTKYWFRQILEALSYCHSNSITHRNLTIKNVLITSSRDVKLTGFDFSTIFSHQALNLTTCGSAYYIPPEILAGEPYEAPKGDVWCAGVVVVYMLTRIYPFPAIKPINLLKLHQDGIEKSEAWSVLKTNSGVSLDFIKSFFKLDPGKRPTVDMLLGDLWIRKLAQISDIEFTKP